VYLIRALSVIIHCWAQIPLPARQTSDDRDYVIQALHVLDAMDSDNAVRKITMLVRELFTLLSAPIQMTTLQSPCIGTGVYSKPMTFSKFDGLLIKSHQRSLHSQGSTFSGFNFGDPPGFGLGFPNASNIGFSRMEP